MPKADNKKAAPVASTGGSNNIRQPEQNEKTFPCKFCGRQFIKSSLVKHEPSCKKLTKLQRKVFDSGQQRATGSDININGVRKAQKEKEKLGGTFPRPKTHWKERHDQFIQAVSASKQVDYALKTGTPLPPPPKSTVPSDYVKCDYCGRNFSQTAADRHIPFCKQQNSRRQPAQQTKPLPTASKKSLQQKASGSRLHTTGGDGSVNNRRASTPIRSTAATRSSSSNRPTINSAGPAPVPKHRSALPQPTAPAMKRSNSAPRTPGQPGATAPTGTKIRPPPTRGSVGKKPTATPTGPGKYPTARPPLPTAASNRRALIKK